MFSPILISAEVIFKGKCILTKNLNDDEVKSEKGENIWKRGG
jgi:hypothetical protein